MRTTTFLAITVALAALTGCTRSVPTEFPRASAASAGAAEAPRAVLGRAIVEEPPLPGERRQGWEALDEGAPAADHSGHHGHGAHGHHGHGGHGDAQ